MNQPQQPLTQAPTQLDQELSLAIQNAQADPQLAGSLRRTLQSALNKLGQTAGGETLPPTSATPQPGQPQGTVVRRGGQRHFVPAERSPQTAPEGLSAAEIAKKQEAKQQESQPTKAKEAAIRAAAQRRAQRAGQKAPDGT